MLISTDGNERWERVDLSDPLEVLRAVVERAGPVPAIRVSRTSSQARQKRWRLVRYEIRKRKDGTLTYVVSRSDKLDYPTWSNLHGVREFADQVAGEGGLVRLDDSSGPIDTQKAIHVLRQIMEARA